MEEIKLLDFIKGNLPENEELEVLGWIEESEANRREYNRLKNIYALSALAGDKGSREILGEEARGITRMKKRKLLSALYKYAAVVLLTAGLASSLYIYRSRATSGYLSSIFYSVKSPPGQSTELTLADGSEVFLNSGTILKYPADYSVSKRDLRLQGEAFFNVETNKKKPFVVTVGELEVVATGTSFNIDGYKEDNEINVTLVEGSANIRSTGGQFLMKLEPGENARLDLKTNQIVKTKVNTSFYTSWKKGIITFSNKRLEDISHDLERWYNVQIIFDKQASKDIRYSGAILKNKPIDQVLEILKITSNFSYEITVDDDKKSIITIK